MQLKKRLPWLVTHVRLAKRAFGLLRRGHDSPISLPHNLTIAAVPGRRNTWFGYYDHSPFSPEDENILLVHTTDSRAWQQPRPDQAVEVMLMDWRSSRIVKRLGETYSWNWQQGARAQWLSSEIIISNIYDKKSAQYRAMLVEPSTNEHHVLPISVQEADRNGRVYSISFEALAAIRPDYGYRNKEWTDQDILENRIRSYDTNSGRVREFVGVQELLIEAKERHGDSISLPKLNHVMASPSGKNLIFLFRYFVHGHRITDLYVLEVATGAWRCLVGNRGVSHSHWLDDTTIITTMQGEQGFGYYWIDIVTGTTELVWRQSDGHPSPLGKRGFVTDTYPDNKAVRGLFMVPWDDPANCWMLGRFPEPLLFLGETRCDLHPVTSPSARWIQIDLALGHQRRVGVLPVPKWGS